ncbi:hypothetical protein ACFVRB_41850 [Streptomyces nojiriensis]|uniref:hypothetical protein n=1 Tax=Streptomyces nojiriensis TaxID=66374 RepID=UPI0036DC349B
MVAVVATAGDAARAAQPWLLGVLGTSGIAAAPGAGASEVRRTGGRPGPAAYACWSQEVKAVRP